MRAHTLAVAAIIGSAAAWQLSAAPAPSHLSIVGGAKGLAMDVTEDAVLRVSNGGGMAERARLTASIAPGKKGCALALSLKTESVVEPGEEVLLPVTISTPAP